MIASRSELVLREGGSRTIAGLPPQCNHCSLLSCELEHFVVSVPALLDPAERQLMPRLQIRVDPDISRSDLSNVAVYAVKIFTPDTRSQAITGVVRQCNGFV